jgi:cullin 2
VAHPEPFADRLYQETKSFLDEHVKVLLVKVRANGETNLLKSYHEAWVEYSTGIGYLHHLYL